ncbi:MAG: DinB family protein [Acidobacteriota bacterium]|jgi:uncharacterized damage-inducible protein DinB|nr:DinB family protein [Acidobacteriota bacterium]
MNDQLNSLTGELEEISQNAQKTFGNLSAEQINWRPSADGWSVGQCFEHLIKTNGLFFPELKKIAKGKRKNSLVENYSPLSSFFGNLLVKSLQKDARKFKAPSQKIVPPSEVSADIINQFAAHQREVAEKIEQTAEADWQKTVITSPFMKLMTYKLADGYRVVVEHERRHLRQAERVLQTEGFPK